MPAALPLSRLLVACVLLLASLSLRAEQLPPRLDVPYVPTPTRVVERMLELAEVGPDDYLIDLGSGDGRIAIAAVKDRDAREALGVDLNPVRIEEAERNAQDAGVSDRVRFEQGDLFEKDISEASVLTMYLLPKVNLRLRPVILDTLKPGTRVVSHAFSMDDWKADASEVIGGSYVYLWIVPAKVEGRWQVQNGQAQPLTLDLRQRFQMVEGEVEEGSGTTPVAGRLRGDQLIFTLGDERYVGRVEGDRMQAVAEDGAVADWSARRL